MRHINLFCSLKVLEKLEQDNPLVRKLTLSIQVKENNKFLHQVTFFQDCYINNTSTSTGIVEESHEDNFRFLTIYENFNPHPDRKYTFQKETTLKNIEELFNPELFFFYDQKHLKFLSSQIKVDNLEKYTYLIIDDKLVNKFFNNIKNVLNSDVLPDLEINDKISLYNFNY